MKNIGHESFALSRNTQNGREDAWNYYAYAYLLWAFVQTCGGSFLFSTCPFRTCIFCCFSGAKIEWFSSSNYSRLECKLSPADAADAAANHRWLNRSLCVFVLILEIIRFYVVYIIDVCSNRTVICFYGYVCNWMHLLFYAAHKMQISHFVTHLHATDLMFIRMHGTHKWAAARVSFVYLPALFAYTQSVIIQMRDASKCCFLFGR